MTILNLNYWHATSVRVSAGIAMLGFSCFFLSDHATAVRQMRETGLPAAVELPVLEKRMAILKEQNEIAQLQAALSTGSAQEMLDAYALPFGTGSVRALAQLDAVFTHLTRNHDLLEVSAVSVGEREEGIEGTSILPMTFTAHVTRNGWKKLMLFINVSGLMTVGDTVEADELAELLSLTEQENPATVAALEQFFSVDILRYAAEPRPFEEALLKSFSTDVALRGVRTFLSNPHLQAMRDLLGPMSDTLRANRLWPLQFLQIQETSQHVRDDGTLDVTVTIGAYGRATMR